MSTERRILLWMCALTAVNQLGFGGMMASLPLYAASFGVPASAIGLAVGVYGLARFCLAAPSGQISDRLGRRPALALGGALTAAGNLGCALASTYPEFILARFVAGAGAGLIITTGQIVLADITTPERRGRTMALYQGTFIFAVGIGPLPGGLLAQHFGLAAPFWAHMVAGSVAGLLAWFAVGETRDLAHARRVHAHGQGPSYLAQLQALSRQTGFVLVCLVAFIQAVTRTGALFSIVPLLASTRLGLSVTTIGAGLAAGSVAGLLATYPSGMMVDYFGRKTVIWPAAILAGASMLLFGIAPSMSWFMAACLVWGIASAVGGAAPSAYAADSAPPGLNATTIGVYRMAGDAGYVVGPILLGLLTDLRGPDAALLISAGLLGAVAVLFAWLAPETHRNRQ